MCLVSQLYLTLCNPIDCSPPGSSVHGNSPGKNTGVVAMPSSRGSFQPRDWTQVSCIVGWFFTNSHKGSPTGVVSLSLLQPIFLTQESNHGLLHCRQILYQLNYQGKGFLMASPHVEVSLGTETMSPKISFVQCISDNTLHVLWSFILNWMSYKVVI